MDLEDRNHNTRDGLHMASLAGAWTGLVGGMGGMRARDGRLSFSPRLPGDISRLRFRVSYRGSGIEVETDGHTATYRLCDGPPLTIHHEGEAIELGEEAVDRPVTPVAAEPRPLQPPGREPQRRGPQV